MRFYLDTNHFDTLSIQLTKEEQENLDAEVVSNFLSSIASFTADFALNKMEITDKETALNFKDLCFEVIGNVYEDIIEESFSEEDDEEEDYENLVNQLVEKGYSPQEIEEILALIEEKGGLSNALELISEKIEEE